MGLLRILLAASVLAAHIHGKSIMSFRLVHGDLAVQSFFMISGFYMALVLNQKYRPGQYWTFLQQRWLRLMPAYWVILGLNVLTAVFFISRLPAEHAYMGWLHQAQIPNAASLAWFGFVNIFILGYETLFFTTVNPDTGSLNFVLDPPQHVLSGLNFSVIGPAWSLSLEMMFYLIAPFLVRLPWRAQAGVVLASLALRWGCVVFFHLHSTFFDNRCFPFELGFFMAGSLAYQVYVRYGRDIARSASRWQWARWFFYAIVVAYSRLPGPDFIHYHLFIIMLFVMIPVLFAMTKDTLWDRYVGELSYSFYLSHPMIILLTSALVQKLPDNRWGVAYLLLCLCFSYLLYRFFEVKVDRWRESLLERRPRVQAEEPVAVTN